MIGVLFDIHSEVIVFRRENGDYVAKSRNSFDYSTKMGLYTTTPKEIEETDTYYQ